MSSIAPPPRRLRLVRGSHIVLKMPTSPRKRTPTPCRTPKTRVIFALPWLERRFLIVGTTEVPESGDPAAAGCSLQEQAYLLDAYNRYFARPGGPVTDKDMVWSFAGVRALQDDYAKKPSRLSEAPGACQHRQRHRRLRHTLWRQAYHPPGLRRDRCSIRCATLEQRWRPLDQGRSALRRMRDTGGSFFLSSPKVRQRLSRETCQRWAFAYGDQIERLYADRPARSASRAGDRPRRAPCRADHAVEVEDA